jgi:spore coat polysaccharide biosynthesis protein SpsF
MEVGTVMIACIIQSRLGSQRLPGKALMLLGGFPMVFSMMKRVQQISCIDVVDIAIPYDDFGSYYDANDGSCGIVAFEEIHERDVYKRYLWALDRNYKIETCIRITGDCPLICPDIIQRVVKHHLEGHCLYTSNDTMVSGYPDGMDVEVFNVQAFRDHRPVNDDEREHVTMALRRSVVNGLVLSPMKWPKFKLSVDTEEDYQTVKRIYDECHGHPPTDSNKLCGLLWRMKHD